MYEIIMRHNRPWTTREVLFFVILFVLVTYVLVRLFKKKRIVLSQVFAGYNDCIGFYGIYESSK